MKLLFRHDQDTLEKALSTLATANFELGRAEALRDWSKDVGSTEGQIRAANSMRICKTQIARLQRIIGEILGIGA